MATKANLQTSFGENLKDIFPGPFSEREENRKKEGFEPGPGGGDQEQEDFVNWFDGFPRVFSASVASNGKYVERKDFNTILWYLSKAIRFFQCGLSPMYDVNVRDNIGGYPKDAVVTFPRTDGKGKTVHTRFRSKVDNNKSVPAAKADDGTWVVNDNWESLQPLLDVKMMDNSTNGVENWAIKKYIDAIKPMRSIVGLEKVTFLNGAGTLYVSSDGFVFGYADDCKVTYNGGVYFMDKPGIEGSRGCFCLPVWTGDVIAVEKINAETTPQAYLTFAKWKKE